MTPPSSHFSAVPSTFSEKKPLRGIFFPERNVLKGRPVHRGTCFLGWHHRSGEGIPSLLQGGRSISAMAAVSSPPPRVPKRKDFEEKQSEPCTPLTRAGPKGLVLHPFPGPQLVCCSRNPRLLNGPLCAQRWPGRARGNAGPRCPLWVPRLTSSAELSPTLPVYFASEEPVLILIPTDTTKCSLLLWLRLFYN